MWADASFVRQYLTSHRMLYPIYYTRIYHTVYYAAVPAWIGFVCVSTTKCVMVRLFHELMISVAYLFEECIIRIMYNV